MQSLPPDERSKEAFFIYDKFLAPRTKTAWPRKTVGQMETVQKITTKLLDIDTCNPLFQSLQQDLQVSLVPLLEHAQVESMEENIDFVGALLVDKGFGLMLSDGPLASTDGVTERKKTLYANSCVSGNNVLQWVLRTLLPNISLKEEALAVIRKMVIAQILRPLGNHYRVTRPNIQMKNQMTSLTMKRILLIMGVLVLIIALVNMLLISRYHPGTGYWYVTPVF